MQHEIAEMSLVNEMATSFIDSAKLGNTGMDSMTSSMVFLFLISVMAMEASSEDWFDRK